MCKRNLLAIFAIASSIGTAVFAQSSSNPELPPGPMQAKVTTACTECHEARIILQQRLGKAAWTKEVDKMMKWGALVSPEDHEAFVDYLSSNFGVDKPAYVADRLKNSSRKNKY
jgi:hypothetical protein